MSQNNSIWVNDVKLKKYPSLDKNIKTSVLIVGGGLAGCLCGYLLQQKGVDCIIVEGKQIGMGITKNTTAVISAQHDTPYYELIKMVGRIKAHHYLTMNLAAVEKYKELSKEYSFDYEDKPSYMYSINDKKVLLDEIKALKSLNYNAELVDQIDLPFNIKGAVGFMHQGQIHPLKFLKAITKNLKIYEDTFINKIDGHYAYTDKYMIEADKIIITTHFPFINSSGFYFTKMFQKRSFVIAIKTDKPLLGTYQDIDKQGLYFRSYQDYLLIGGSDVRVGKNKNAFERIRAFINKYYPNTEEAYYWGNQDCITLDNMPYIGQYSKKLPHVYVATGFNFWGFTSSMVSAMLLSDLITNKDNPYLDTFNPNRNVLHKQLFLNMGEFIISFIKPTNKRCSHLGCSLIYNKEEHTWDCPCHGSRYNEDGVKIENPAMKDIKIVKKASKD